MTREEIAEGLKLLEDNMVHFDELQNDKGEWIDVHELLFEAIQALSQEPKQTDIEQKAQEYEKAFMDGFESCSDLFTRNKEQQPCDDAISRKELLKAIDTWDKFGYTETGCFVREPKSDYVPYIHYDDVIKCIKGMPSVTPKPIECEDAVSRDAVMGLVAREHTECDDLYIDIAKLPSVTPRRKGHWNEYENYQGGIKETWYECSECKWSSALLIPRKYCPNCGAEMKG